MKLFCVSGHVRHTGMLRAAPRHDPGRDHRRPLRRHAAGEQFKACLPAGPPPPIFTSGALDVPMDFDPVAKAGSRLGTGGIVVFDQDTCMVAATLNLVRFYARESCGWCTPCREGLPFVVDLLERIEAGQGSEEDIDILREHVKYLNYAFCALAPGAMGPVEGLLRHFEDEMREHITSAHSGNAHAQTDHRRHTVEVPDGTTVLEAAQAVESRFPTSATTRPWGRPGPAGSARSRSWTARSRGSRCPACCRPRTGWSSPPPTPRRWPCGGTSSNG